MWDLAQTGEALVGIRRFQFRGQGYVLIPIGPAEPFRIMAAEGAQDARSFDAARWVMGFAAARTEAPDDLLAFYAVAWTDDPATFDDTLAFVAPRARGLRLSHLLIYRMYLALLALDRSFVLCETIDNPRLRLHARCGFAPPVRPLRNGKVEVQRFDLHTVLCRIESEDDIRELG